MIKAVAAVMAIPDYQEDSATLAGSLAASVCFAVVGTGWSYVRGELGRLERDDCTCPCSRPPRHPQPKQSLSKAGGWLSLLGNQVAI